MPSFFASCGDGGRVGRIDAGVLLEQLGVRRPLERRREVDRLARAIQCCTSRLAVTAAADRVNRLADALLGEIHHRAVIAVGLIDLEHRELGIVLRADPLVAVDAAEFVDPLDAADQQPLEVQLQRDPHEQIEVERVVMRRERPGRGAAGDRVQRRAFDFDEAAIAERLANRRDDPRPIEKPVEHPFVVGQVEIPLPRAAVRRLAGRYAFLAAFRSTWSR